MTEPRDEIVAASLERLEQGESIEEILARYPAESVALRPLLETATQLSQMATLPTLAAKRASQRAFLAEARSLKESEPAPRLPRRRLRRAAWTLATILLILFVGGAGLTVASAPAVPGDILYGAKRFVEGVRLQNAGSADAVRELSEQFQAERRREIAQLLQQGSQETVAFEGVIEAMQVDEWLVAGIIVGVGNDTQIEGAPQVGALARVVGETGEGRLLASHILVIGARPRPAPTPIPTPIGEPAATETTVPVPTPVPTATATPAVPTLEPSEEGDPTPEPDSTPPAAEPGDDDPGDEQSDGNDPGDEGEAGDEPGEDEEPDDSLEDQQEESEPGSDGEEQSGNEGESDDDGASSEDESPEGDESSSGGDEGEEENGAGGEESGGDESSDDGSDSDEEGGDGGDSEGNGDEEPEDAGQPAATATAWLAAAPVTR